jgi:hypothetical protein
MSVDTNATVTPATGFEIAPIRRRLTMAARGPHGNRCRRDPRAGRFPARAAARNRPSRAPACPNDRWLQLLRSRVLQMCLRRRRAGVCRATKTARRSQGGPQLGPAARRLRKHRVADRDRRLGPGRSGRHQGTDRRKMSLRMPRLQHDVPEARALHQAPASRYWCGRC